MAPNSVSRGSIKMINTMARIMLTTTDSVIAFPTPFWAAFASPSPSFRLKYAAPPLPIIMDSASAMIVMGKTMLVAPLPR